MREGVKRESAHVLCYTCVQASLSQIRQMSSRQNSLRTGQRARLSMRSGLPELRQAVQLHAAWLSREHASWLRSLQSHQPLHRLRPSHRCAPRKAPSGTTAAQPFRAACWPRISAVSKPFVSADRISCSTITGGSIGPAPPVQLPQPQVPRCCAQEVPLWTYH
jgi:hypothetical protein